jgi:hypothetical protein
MTRKDYELIAKSIKVDREGLGIDAKVTADFIAAGLAEQFAAMNPRFDSRRFLDACGVGQ